MLFFKNINFNIPNFIHSGYYLLDYKHYLRRFQTYLHHTGSDRKQKQNLIVILEKYVVFEKLCSSVYIHFLRFCDADKKHMLTTV